MKGILFRYQRSATREKKSIFDYKMSDSSREIQKGSLDYEVSVTLYYSGTFSQNFVPCTRKVEVHLDYVGNHHCYDEATVHVTLTRHSCMGAFSI